MTITARFPSRCPSCGGRISVGDQVEWSRGQKARHSDCKTAKARRFADVGIDDDDRSYEAWFAAWAPAGGIANMSHFDHRGPHCHSQDYFCSRHGYQRCRCQEPKPVLADDSEAFEIVEPLSGSTLATFAVPRRSRWSRPDDDELESAADPLDNWLAKKLAGRTRSEEAA